MTKDKSLSLFAIGGGTYYGVKAYKNGYRGWDVVWKEKRDQD